MDHRKILSSKLTFIKNYLHGISGSYLSLPCDWFYVSEPMSDKDAYGHQSFKVVDLFRENKDSVIKELKEVNIEVKITPKMYIFKKC
jgi:hypothetical protein